MTAFAVLSITGRVVKEKIRQAVRALTKKSQPITTPGIPLISLFQLLKTPQKMFLEMKLF